MNGRIPKVGGVEWFGDPLGDEGAVFMVHHGTTPVEMYRELMLVAALKNGAEHTPELQLEIEMRARERAKQDAADTLARGISPGLRALVAAKRKKDVEKVARDLVIEHGEFSDLMRNARLLGLSWYSEHFHWMPEGRRLTDEEREELLDESNAPGSKLVGKFRQGFEEREHRSVHMLTNAAGTKWHCFYLTFRDVAGSPSTGEHHWRDGAHVHFVNYLFGQLTRRAVLEQLAEREHSINGIHLRYDVRRTEPDTGERLYADSTTGRFAKVQMGKGAGPAGGGPAGQ